MAKITGFSVKSLTDKTMKRAIRGVNAALKNRVEFIKKISPIDSGDYINSHKIEGAEFDGSKVRGANFNDSEHAFGVEFGFRKKPVNWSKKDGLTIYNGVGANVYQRTTANRNLVKETFEIISSFIARG